MPMQAQRESRVRAPLILNLGTRSGWVVSATPRPLYPRERAPVPIAQEAGWPPGSVWTGVEERNLFPLQGS